MKSPKKGGIVSSILGVIWMIIALGVILAALWVSGIFKPVDIIPWAKAQAQNLNNCIQNRDCSFIVTPPDTPDVGDGPTLPSNPDLPEVDFGYGGPEKGEGFVLETAFITKEDAAEKLASIPSAESEEVEYSRSEWTHWAPYGDNSCWTTRKEVLYRQSIPSTVSLTDKKKVVVDDKLLACNVSSGSWVDPYSGKIVEDPSKIDIDHIIPLAWAARNGGQAWPKEMKEQFANDVDKNLLATDASQNRKKSDKGPSEYMPPKSEYKCAYSKNWVIVLSDYGLSLPNADRVALETAINTYCKV